MRSRERGKGQRARRVPSTTCWPREPPAPAVGPLATPSPPPSHTRPSETGGLGRVARKESLVYLSPPCALHPQLNQTKPSSTVVGPRGWEHVSRFETFDGAAYAKGGSSHLSVGNTGTRRGVPGAGISQGDGRFRFPRRPDRAVPCTYQRTYAQRCPGLIVPICSSSLDVRTATCVRFRRSVSIYHAFDKHVWRATPA
jgi:hypothetical protein